MSSEPGWGRYILVFSVGLMLGIFFFFPLSLVKDRVLSEITRRSGIHVQATSLSTTTGLGLGIARGGLLALHAEETLIVTAQGQSFRCNELLVSPHIWTLFIGQLKVGFSCDMQKQGRFLGQATLSPIWNPSDAEALITLENVNLSLVTSLFPTAGSFSGTLNGNVNVTELSLQKANAMPRVKWELQGRELSLPAVTAPLINLPSLRIGPLNTQGEFRRASLKVDKFEFGSSEALLSGALTMDFGLDENFMPISGTLKGSLRTQPQFEASLGRLKLDPIFGPVKASGQREFRKEVKGNVLSLMMSPPLDN